MLQESADSLLDKYQNLEIVSIAAEYEEGLRKLGMYDDRAKLILWLGSSIGNFKPDEAVRFLGSVAATLKPEDFLLIGFDLVKDSSLLESAYNDEQGVTAAFNVNILARINRELSGAFDLEKFVHHAPYNEEKDRIEMYLISTCEQDVHIDDLGRTYHFEANERIHTENSHKFSPERIERIAARSGLRIIEQWFDARQYFNLTLFRPDG
jgi:dimethylhistidine N-methyltransferase